jgi:cytochrome P450
MTLYTPFASRTQDGDAEKGLSLLDLKYAQPSARVPLFQRLRQHGLVYDERSKCWLCAHVSGLTSILGDGRFTSRRPSGSETPPTSPGKAWRGHSAPGSALREMKVSIEQILGRQLLVKDGADHTRVQGIMNPVLRQMGHDMSASIGQRVEELLDAFAPTGQVGRDAGTGTPTRPEEHGPALAWREGP